MSSKNQTDILLFVISFGFINLLAAQTQQPIRNYQTNRGIVPFKLMSDISQNKFVDLDSDGDPDLLYITLTNGKFGLWIDDDDDMKTTDLEGDLDSDCLLIDINNDEKFGGQMDLNIDLIDTDNDGRADIQIVVDNGKSDFHGKWESHFLVFFDDDHDGVFSYVDYEELKFEGWDHAGMADFFADYHGKSKMLKVHITTSDIANLEYNWENPFLWYDTDKDGLTEMAVRVVDEPINKEISDQNPYSWAFSKKASLIQQTWDLDNDSAPGNELDLDMSLKFVGDGFDYSDQIHPIGNNKIIAEADVFFQDPRWRHLTSFTYPDHDQVMKLTHQRGKWSQCWFVFDEDDDCNRWERVRVL